MLSYVCTAPATRALGRHIFVGHSEQLHVGPCGLLSVWFPQVSEFDASVLVVPLASLVAFVGRGFVCS